MDLLSRINSRKSFQNERPPTSKSIRTIKSHQNLRVTTSKIYRNPFFNFLRSYRKTAKGNMNICESARHCGQLWRGMTQIQKLPYLKLSREVPKKVKVRKTKQKRKRDKRGSRTKRFKMKANDRFLKHHHQYYSSDTELEDRGDHHQSKYESKTRHSTPPSHKD